MVPWGIDKAAAYASRFGIARVQLEAALRAGDIPSTGVLPNGGWTIDPDALDAWCEAQL